MNAIDFRNIDRPGVPSLDFKFVPRLHERENREALDWIDQLRQRGKPNH